MAVRQIDIDIVRGNTKPLVVRIASGFVGREDWQGRFVIREAQDDGLDDLFSRSVPIDTEDTHPDYPDSIGTLTFTLAPQETQDLPPYRLVHFVELHAPDHSDSQRLFEGRVKVRD